MALADSVSEKFGRMYSSLKIVIYGYRSVVRNDNLDDISVGPACD